MNEVIQEEHDALKLLNPTNQTLASKLLSVFGTQCEYETNEKAIELLNIASNKYRMSNRHLDSARCIERIITIKNSLHNDIKDSLDQLLQTYKYIDDPRKFDVYEQLIGIHLRKGNNSRYNTLLLEVAKSHHKNNDLELAIDALNRCSPLHSLILDALVLKAEISIQMGNHKDAYEMYKEVYTKHSSSRYGNIINQKYIYKSLLCVIAYDHVVFPNEARNVDAINPSFFSSLDGSFIRDISKAYDDYDVETFETLCREKDRIKPLDQEDVRLLIKIKDEMVKFANDEVDLA